MEQNRAKNPIQTTQSSFLLLQFLVDAGGATLIELTDNVDLSKGAVYNHLATLQELGVVVRRDDVYYASLRTFQFGESARQTFPGSAVARKKLWDLADATGEFASLVAREDDAGIVMDIAAGQLADTIYLTAGEEIPLYSTAAGKVILSQMSEQRVDNLYSGADETVNINALREEIQTVKAQGLAFSRSEYRDDQYSVAAPVLSSSSDLIYVVTLTGPKDRLGGKALQQDVAGLVVSTANEIQKNLYS